MEIGIITQPFSGNYGGILQNWALQQVLIRMGHDPVTVECSGPFSPAQEWKCLKMNTKTLLGRLTGHGPSRWMTWEKRAFIEEVSQPLRAFVDRQIRTRRLTYPQLKAFSSEPSAWIVGSDQVWRPAYNPSLSLPFLTFAGTGTRKIAYAASFGVDGWEYSPSQTAFARKALASFSAVSVRENSGTLLCRDHLGVEAVRTLDPTLLLSPQDYSGLCGAVPSCGNALVVYCLDPSAEKLRLASDRAACLGLGTDVVLPFSLAGLERREADGFRMRPVEDWLRSFMEAGAVFCDSYHGLLFGLLFGKKVLLSPHSERGLSRFSSILEDLGLPVRPDADGIVSLDAGCPAERLAALGEASLGFLQAAL